MQFEFLVRWRNLALFPVALYFLFPCFAAAQVPNTDLDSANLRLQTLRGTVSDAQSHLPVARATITIQGTKLGAISATDGEYHIANVPIGHYFVKAVAVGYGPTILEIVIGSAHQAVLDFGLEERSMKGDTITVSAQNALGTINRTAVVSVTPFNIEDVNRYVAAFQDPSRMAENFAGVFGRGTTNNYIVVRGGSPIELEWLLDGIDIPDPNHLGKAGSSGGLISTINTHMLGNSDFLTGAFPAEYGTKLSAVFDMHTRDGNTEKPEGMAEVSFTGLELGLESPIPGMQGSSILGSFRHSTIGVVKELGLLGDYDIPTFDDAMLKLHLVFGEYDQLNGTGLWGSSSFSRTTNTTGSELGLFSGQWVGGLDWQHIYTSELVGHLRVNYVSNQFGEGVEGQPDTTTIAYTTAKTTLTWTPTASNSIEVGISGQRGTVTAGVNEFGIDTSASSNFYMGYLNWSCFLYPELVLNTGLFAQHITYTDKSSYEPRASLSWTPVDEHTFAIAFGIHRQPEPLEFAQATHYVMGYTYRPDPNVLLKVEGYLKEYSNVPVHSYEADSYSFMNVGDAETIQYFGLANTGKGRTYGAEFTLLKHYSSGFYITATASLVRQQFAGSDGIWHFGSFDNRYILNLLSGYDIQLTPTSYLTLSEKFTLAGGGMYTPINLIASDSLGYQVLDSAHAFGSRNPPYIRLDINLEFHFNWQKSAMTVYASVLNALNIKNPIDHYYQSSQTPPYNGPGSIQEDLDLPILPVLGFRIEF